MLAQDSRFSVAGEAADASEAQRSASRLQPDVILLDNHLPGVSGIDAIGGLKAAAPQARVVMLTVSENEEDLAAGLREALLARVPGAELKLEYLDAKGRRNGKSRLEYQRPRPGETLATVTAEVERLLIEAVSAQLPRIPAGEPLYCLLLCFTAEDTTAAWPPFLVWGRQPYRQAVLDRGDDEARYYLWAPDEIRDVQGETEEHWFTEPALTEACQRHSQYMELRQSTASATRVLKNVAAWLDAPERRALLTTTDDFVVAVADIAM